MILESQIQSAIHNGYLQRLFPTVISNGYLQRLFPTAISNGYLQRLSHKDNDWNKPRPVTEVYGRTHQQFDAF